MESFAVSFPRVALDSSFKGWVVSILLLLAWTGFLVKGPVAGKFSRKGSNFFTVLVFPLGSELQTAAIDIAMAFVEVIVNSIPTLPALFIYIYDVDFSYSWPPIGWVLPSEMYNLGNRSKAMSLSTSSTWMCNFISGLVTPDMVKSIGYGTYLFFAASAFT